MSAQTNGIHHITALAGDPGRNLAFYTGVLGLRLVKKTVNFDDPGTWHLYFGDKVGRPGAVLTFFPLGPGLPRGTSGNGTVAAVAFAAPPGSFDFWRDRLSASRLVTDEEQRRFGDPMLAFDDPDGLRLELVFTDLADTDAFDDGPVPSDYALTGFHSATMRVEADRSDLTADMLTDVLGFDRADEEAGRTRFATGTKAAGTIVDIVSGDSGYRPRMGPGVVHHIAWRAADGDRQAELREALMSRGVPVSEMRDRSYFQSVYYREPGGVQCEIATDGPGFAIDEDEDSLGSGIRLPERLEPHRDRIEAALPPLDNEEGGE